MINDIKKDANDRMDKSVKALEQALTKIRTGRAHTSLLDHITVEYYGSQVPLNQVSNVNGTVIRVPLPPLTVDRRKDMTKLVRHEAEGGRIAVRNIRRDALSDLKDLLKEKMIGEDDEHRAHDEIQVITDKHVATIDKILEQKESELMEV